MIPKIIHYCWLSNDPIPADLKRYVDSWTLKLQDYQFIKWDFSRFSKESSIWVSEAFDSKKYAFASDYIRLYAVYHFGGIYLDMDVEVLRSFDNLLDRPYMIAAEDEDFSKIEAGCFGAEKGNQYIGMCLEYYKDRHFFKEDGSFDTLVLPIIMMNIIRNNNLKMDLYSWRYFTAKSWFTGKESPSSETYTIHQFRRNMEDRRRTILFGKKNIFM